LLAHVAERHRRAGFVFLLAHGTEISPAYSFFEWGPVRELSMFKLDMAALFLLGLAILLALTLGHVLS
jgi:hypothetical protein